MAEPILHFPRKEHERRIAKARDILSKRSLDALLIFAPESHFYLTGYDSTGYVFFQCGVLTAGSEPYILLTRRPDVQQARDASIIEDIRVWYDAEGVNPAEELKAILAERRLKDARVGIELSTYGLTGFNYERVRRTLEGWCRLEDASDVIRGLRVVKSAAELAHVRRAAELADAALPAMLKAAKPGALESELTAAGMSVILGGGGDMPPAGPLVNAGRRALFGRNVAGPQRLKEQDQVTIEFAATYRRYNVCLMRTAAIGPIRQEQRDMFRVTRDAITAMTEAAKPGRPLGEIDDAHRRVFDAAGHKVHRFSACGYSLGCTYRPSWMDVPPMLYSGNPMPAAPGMVLFLHAFLADAEKELAMSVGHTLVVTETGRDVLSKFPMELPVAG